MRLLLASALLMASVTAAQTGLPSYGVLLSGPVEAPTIINNSSHRILAYTLRFDKRYGGPATSGVDLTAALRNQPLSAVGIGPGESYKHGTPMGPGAGTGRIGPAVQTMNTAGVPTDPAVLDVALDSVWFDDGTFVGPDKSGSFEQTTARIQAEKDVHAILVKATDREAAWVTLGEMANRRGIERPSPSRLYQDRYSMWTRNFADQLVRVKASMGEARALAIAQEVTPYPAIKRVE